MAYLRLRDYYTLIQNTALQALIRSDDALRLTVQKTAQDEVISYLTQKYDTDVEFADLTQFSFTKNYTAGSLIDLNFTAFSATSTYALNDLVTYSGSSYICKTAITVGAPWDATKWTLLGAQYDLFYVPYPYPKFKSDAQYERGDIVFWKDKVYKCLQPSLVIGNKLQYGTYDNVPYTNSKPDESTSQWGTGVDYAFSGLLVTKVPADFTAWSSVITYASGSRASFDSQIWQSIASNTNIEPGSDITKWQPVSWSAGDNRSSQLVQKTIDITLYHLQPGIAPNNGVDIRNTRYEDAIDWLVKCRKGEVTLNSPYIEPRQGMRVRIGGNVKRNNSY